MASMAEAVEQIKLRLGVDPALRGKAAVLAARGTGRPQGAPQAWQDRLGSVARVASARRSTV
jgi:hypothetical protein